MDLLNKHVPLFHKDKHETESLANLNVYVHDRVFKFDNTVTGVIVPLSGNRTHLHYFFFYENDNGLKVFHRQVDAHLYDLEHVIVELTGELVTGVCFFPHASMETFWIRGQDDLNALLVQNRPKTYSSRGKHASYPVSGTIWRYGGFANDQNVPVLVPITSVAASEQLLALDNFDASTFPAIKRRIIGDFSNVPTVALNKARYNMLWRKPKNTDEFIVRNRKAYGSRFTILMLIIVIIVLAVQNSRKNKSL